MIFVCYATQNLNSIFFFLIQTEKGDLFKVTLVTTNRTVTEIKLKYYDTVPVATAICILNTGFLFVASEFSNHYLYQITNLGEDEPEFSSITPLEEGDTFYFAPRQLKNLLIVDEMISFSPIMNSKVANLASEENQQLYLACGRGPRSSLKVLKHGLEVSEMVASVLPTSPNAVWTIKKNAKDVHDNYIVVSFLTTTLVLLIGETIKEVTNSGFLGSAVTLACSSFGNDSAIQVHPGGVRHIKSDKKFQDWKAPGRKQIIKCAVNQYQVVIALTGGDLIYFELESSGLKERQRKDIASNVVCMALGIGKSKFLAIGYSDNTVKIISLLPKNCFSLLATQDMPTTPSSLCIAEMGTILYLNIGLINGILFKIVLDPITGDLTDSFSRSLGIKPVQLFTMAIKDSHGVIAISNRTWLSYFYQHLFHLTPICYKPLEYAASFASEHCIHGIVAISTNSLHILAIKKLGTKFNQVSFPLEYTPRMFQSHPDTGHLFIIETDHKSYTEDKKKEMRLQMAKELEDGVEEQELSLAKELSKHFLNENLVERTFGAPKAGNAMWASLIRIMNPITGITYTTYRLEENESATCLCLLRFSNQPQDQIFLVVGGAKDYQLSPRQLTNGFLYVFRFTDSLEFVHKTIINELPTSLCAFHGKILVGAGKILRLYDLGKKKLLRKCENKYIPNLIVRIEVMGKRIYVSDVQESIFIIRYRVDENQLIIFADDYLPRWITTTAILDYNTVAAADKFGNIVIIRLSNVISDDVEEDIYIKKLFNRSALNGACNKTDFIANFHVGEIITTLQKTALISGMPESIIYTTLSGSIGLLVPFTSHEEQYFFQNLEMLMRSENSLLCGGDHFSYRSYYLPVKNVIDGDLCEQFNSLEFEKQEKIAEDLCRSRDEVANKLEDLRQRHAF